jgi:hypothetical protein
MKQLETSIMRLFKKTNESDNRYTEAVDKKKKGENE